MLMMSFTYGRFHMSLYVMNTYYTSQPVVATLYYKIVCDEYYPDSRSTPSLAESMYERGDDVRIYE